MKKTRKKNQGIQSKNVWNQSKLFILWEDVLMRDWHRKGMQDMWLIKAKKSDKCHELPCHTALIRSKMDYGSIVYGLAVNSVSGLHGYNANSGSKSVFTSY